MADTARSIIFNALKEIGVYAPGETPSDADMEDGLDMLNQMMDHYSVQSLTCFAITEQSFPLVVAKGSYTIGTSGGADVALTRPARIIEGPGAAYAQDASKQNYMIDVVTQDKWNQIGLRTVTANVPDTLFYDPQFPLGIVNVLGVPNSAGYTLFFDSYLQLTQFATLDTAFSLPPGYKAFIQSNIAVWMGPFFKNAVVSADVKMRAKETKRVVKRMNKRTAIAQFDNYLVSRPSGTYNIFTDRGA